MSINKILGITESYKAPERIFEILKNREEYIRIIMELLKQFDKDTSYDWFHEYFEDEHADRKIKKQDFTPNCISDLLSRIVGIRKGTVLEVAAGTGGIIIKHWWNECMRFTPFTYKPSQHFYVCEELSDRAIPFLLLNLVIRGINAIVIHCDSLTRECKGVFFVLNERDDLIDFSQIKILPYNKDVEEFFNVKFTDFRYTGFDEVSQ